jgi:transcriptional regulator with GAF, ATPase, and Fis domain
MNTFEKRFITKSPELEAVTRSASMAAITDVTVLILGESGTGKELLARAIHQESRRSEKPFISLNCAALPEGLAEAELFGHRKGAFTGASENREGRIQAASKGTLFLDEVGELSLNIQAKLLRFLESGECQPVGQTHPESADARIIAATNRNLHKEVKEGRFREDLYYRLNVVPLQLPPLRERTRDISYLLQTLTTQLAQTHGIAEPSYSKETLQILKQYPWPGNVRELRNFCERMLILFNGKTIEKDNLPAEIKYTQSSNAKTSFQLPENGIHLETLETDMLRQALERTGGNRSQAARLLGLTRDTLLYRLKKYAIDL